MMQQPQDHDERPLCILLHVCSKTECVARQNIVCKRDGCSHTSRMAPEGIPNQINFFALSNSSHVMSLHACNLIMKKNGCRNCKVKSALERQHQYYNGHYNCFAIQKQARKSKKFNNANKRQRA